MPTEHGVVKTGAGAVPPSRPPMSEALRSHISRRSEEGSAERRGSSLAGRDVCLAGEWSFTGRPLLHVSHTWMVERRALLGCEWALLSSRRFGTPRDEDVTWTVFLEVDPTAAGAACSTKALRAPETVRVCVAFGTEVPHKRVFFRAALRAQQEAVDADPVAAASSVLDSAGAGDVDVGDLVGMTRADPHTRQHIGDVFLVASDRALTLRVDIAYLGDTLEARPGPATVAMDVPPCSLSTDMEALLQDGRMADAVLVAEEDGREFRVHKAILGARSPVFAAMFEHDMAESKTSRVVIGDTGSDVLQQVLRYVYTGRVDHIRELGVELLAVSDRYALARLKALCEDELAASVRPDNCLDVLAMADLYGARQLREAALQCVCASIHQVLASPAWPDLIRARPHLLHQVLAKCVNYPSSDAGTQT
ncbi:hypothetical protein ONE63_009027 [Megalurothrips usitatus]|uniref:BTB domain-containing protein n=1 Tax=Megalurothrips usitatus TaxID=439358 RepID=A0AAV7XLZ8_9NEOP|nr:hypothetical protein ONE63_009027 [Megalurothrips usitatus]